MLLGWDALDAHEWSRLSHAYGLATDTPEHLQRLVDGDDAAWSDAIDHLYGALTHQGSVYLATAPAALVAAGILTDPRLSHPVAAHRSEPVPLRAHLLNFLGAVADGTEPTSTEAELREAYCTPHKSEISPAWDGPDLEGYEAIIQCRAVSPVLVDPVLQCLRDDDPDTRLAATSAAALLSQVPTVVGRRAEILAVVERQARKAGTYCERANALIWLDRLSAVDSSFLFDRHPGIRLIAALASSRADDPDGTSAILDAVSNPDHAAEWYSDSRTLLFTEGWPNHLLSKAVRRVANFADLLPTALVVAAGATHSPRYEDLELLLGAAFPKGYSPTSPLNEAQRAYLHALLNNSDIWNPWPSETSRGMDTYLARIGLPSDHRSLSAIVNAYK
jgi:hypothetical protein